MRSFSEETWNVSRLSAGWRFNSFQLSTVSPTRWGEADGDTEILTVVSELDAGGKRELCPLCWNVLRPDDTNQHHEKGGRRCEDKAEGGRGWRGSDLLSCCSPLIMGFTMPLSISSFPELCTQRNSAAAKLTFLINWLKMKQIWWNPPNIRLDLRQRSHLVWLEIGMQRYSVKYWTVRDKTNTLTDRGPPNWPDGPSSGAWSLVWAHRVSQRRNVPLVRLIYIAARSERAAFVRCD